MGKTHSYTFDPVVSMGNTDLLRLRRNQVDYLTMDLNLFVVLDQKLLVKDGGP